MRIVSAFAGIGGFDIAFERAGCQIVAQIEKDPGCQAVLRQRFPDVPLFGDISEVKGADLPEFDVLVGGFPCQDLSVAGSRAGLKGERSGLFFEFARLVEETRPAWWLLENVPGLLSSHGGRDMGTLLGTMGELGYWWSYRCLDAQFFGVPQRRRRVFVVGHLGGPAGPQAVLFEPESSRRDTSTVRAARKAAARVASNGAVGVGLGHGDDRSVAGPIGSGTKGAGLRTTDLESVGAYVLHGHFAPDTVSQAMCSKWHKGVSGPAGDEHHNLVAVAYSVYPESGQGADLRATEAEIAPTVSATDGGKATERGLRIVQAFPVAQRGREDGSDLELGEEGLYNALRAGDGGSSRHQLVAYVEEGDNRRSSLIGAADGRVWRRLPSRRAVAFRKATKAHFSGDWERWEETERVDALAAEGATLAATAVVEPYTFDWQAGGHGDTSFRGRSRIYPVRKPGRAGALQGNKVEAVAIPADEVPTRLSVRRLTPLECERLQGFPDGWTDGQVDSQRYRQIGNAVAVPVATWIARRMAFVHENPPGAAKSFVAGGARYVKVRRSK